MIAAADFNITLTNESRLKEFNVKEIPFGKYFTDHMLVVDYADGEWKTPQIMPYGPLQMSPAASVLHYGQAIFEGIKAYKFADGNVYIFRPEDNFKRFNLSAERMMMPEVPEEIFMEGMRTLISIDNKWIPQKADHALYIRPFMIGTEEALGVKPSNSYKFIILLSPTGPYYSAPMRIKVEEYYVRAVNGGVGSAKCAGNYAASLYAATEAQKQGFDQVLWTDAHEHKYIHECGTMNVFFIIGNTAITPDLVEGTTLAGVTRDSVITMLREAGLKVEERPLNIDEAVAAYKAGTLKEVFGTGTAATISPIKELVYKGFSMQFDITKWTVSPELKRKLDGIRNGEEPDTHGWLYKV